jgi:hypothetical protein
MPRAVTAQRTRRVITSVRSTLRPAVVGIGSVAATARWVCSVHDQDYTDQHLLERERACAAKCPCWALHHTGTTWIEGIWDRHASEAWVPNLQHNSPRSPVSGRSWLVALPV